MITYLKENIQLYILLAVLVACGIAANFLAFPAILVTVFLLHRQKWHIELMLAFWFILVLSDSLAPALDFAKTAKHLFTVLYAVVPLISWKSYPRDFRMIKLFIPFFLVALIAMLSSVNIMISAQKTLSYFLIFAATPLYVLRAYQEEGMEAFRKIIYFGVVILLIGMVLKYISPDMAHIAGRFRGLLGNSNGMGIFVLMFFLLFQIVEDTFPKLFSRRESWFILLVILVNVYWSGSRNTIISIAMFYILKHVYKLAPMLGFVVFLAMVYLYQIISDNIVGIIVSLEMEDYFRVHTLETGSGRLIAWKFAWEQLQDYFFMGRGFANDELTMRPHYSALGRLGHQGGVHNSYLSMWMDVGLIGLLAYFIPVVLIFLKGSSFSRIAFPILYTILFTLIFESWLVGSQNPYTIVFVMILSILFYIQPLAKKAKESENEDEQADTDIRAVPGSPVS